METNFYDKIKLLCEKHKLSEEIKKEITKLCSDAYIAGSNDCFKIEKKQLNKSFKKTT
jgi:hypothetical protein